MSISLVQIYDPDQGKRVGAVRDGSVWDLTSIDSTIAASTLALISAERSLPVATRKLLDLAQKTPTWRFDDLNREPGAYPHLVPPIDAPEVWAAGVTYTRSKEARMMESKESRDLYARVYDAARPELFMKTSHMLRTSGPNQPVGIRTDSRWNVPEPELALVLGDRGDIVGYTIANDVSSRDIEGQNALYLPQAKIFRGCCSLGPTLLIADETLRPNDWEIDLRITKGNHLIFSESIGVARLKRGLEHLVAYLCLDNEILPGTVLMTGTGIVPPDDFSLEPGHVVHIAISQLGALTNPVVSASDLPNQFSGDVGGRLEPSVHR